MMWLWGAIRVILIVLISEKNKNTRNKINNEKLWERQNLTLNQSVDQMSVFFCSFSEMKTPTMEAFPLPWYSVCNVLHEVSGGSLKLGRVGLCRLFSIPIFEKDDRAFRF